MKGHILRVPRIQIRGDENEQHKHPTRELSEPGLAVSC